jgi:hypothetical protein
MRKELAGSSGNVSDLYSGSSGYSLGLDADYLNFLVVFLGSSGQNTEIISLISPKSLPLNQSLSVNYTLSQNHSTPLNTLY